MIFLRLNVIIQRLLNRGCYFEEKHGWERPGYFIHESSSIEAREYDYYGYYGNEKHVNYPYRDRLEVDYSFDYPGDTHKLVMTVDLLKTRKQIETTV